MGAQEKFCSGGIYNAYTHLGIMIHDFHTQVPQILVGMSENV